jgi:hypothetical protein
MLNKSFSARFCGLAAALGAAVVFPACGGNNVTGGTITTTTTMPPCTQTTLFQGGAALPARTVDEESFATTTMGRLDVTLDWTFPASPFGVYVVQGSCNLAQFNARTCNFLLSSEPGGPKPRKVSAPNVAPGSYSLLIANFSSQNESVSTQVVQSSATCPPLAAAAPTTRSETPDLQISELRTGILRH